VDRPTPHELSDKIVKRGKFESQEEEMSITEAQGSTPDANVGKVDMKLEVQIIPVSDVDRSKDFYVRLGWRLDADDAPLEGLRIVQFTPPGSGASVTFGKGLTRAAPGSGEGGLIVSDIEVAHHELAGRSIPVSDVWHGPPFPPEARQPGPDPNHTSYGSFFSFSDPDGNTWLVQEVTTRLPGRVDATQTAFASVADLASALGRAESAHGQYEKGNGHGFKEELAGRLHDQHWAAWYATYIVAEQTGTDLPQNLGRAQP
jgi:catechol 2,3-dioxygenase-like lactoylglutathione lyase family enzyme